MKDKSQCQAEKDRLSDLFFQTEGYNRALEDESNQAVHSLDKLQATIYQPAFLL
jgi:hypothetical protein